MNSCRKQPATDPMQGNYQFLLKAGSLATPRQSDLRVVPRLGFSPRRCFPSLCHSQIAIAILDPCCNSE